MKHYLITITFNNPFPVSKEYRADGSSFRTSIGKALAEFKKDNKGKRIKEVSIKAIVL